MNLPEPSGSSPPEKPPGRITICALRIEFSSCSALSRRASAEKLRTTTISAAPPAFLNRTGGVVLAVGALEYRNNSQRLCALDAGADSIALGEGNLGQMLVGSSRLGGEHALELALEGIRQLVERYGLAGNRDLLIVGGIADQPVSGQLGCGFDQDAAEVLEVQRVRREANRPS